MKTKAYKNVFQIICFVVNLLSSHFFLSTKTILIKIYLSSSPIFHLIALIIKELAKEIKIRQKSCIAFKSLSFLFFITLLMMFLSNRKSIFCFDRFQESVDRFESKIGREVCSVMSCQKFFFILIQFQNTEQKNKFCNIAKLFIMITLYCY